MATSRLEKIGTIYTRTQGLLISGAMKWVDRPLWFDLYEAFPPKEEPRFDRPAPKVPIRKIFYQEDKIRAIFHRNNKQLGTVNMFNDTKTITQRFIDVYKKLEEEYKGTASQEQMYQEAIEMLKRERLKHDAEPDETQISLSTSFKAAQNAKERETSLNVKIGEIFKD